MTESEIKEFIRIVTDYFNSVSGVSASMGLPYVKERSTSVFDYTGVIGISGNRKGGIYLTAGEEFLRSFGTYILGSEELSQEELYDLIGEMTNTVSGNMREIFGSDFLISVPIILKGKIDEIVVLLKPPVFLIPISWNGFEAVLGIGLE